MREQVSVTNIIGGRHILTQELWALSLVRKKNADHAYLIMEGINKDNQRVVMDAHLVQQKTNEKQANVVYRDISDRLDELQQIGESCSSYTWSINRHQADTLVSLIQSEQARAQQGEINYVQAGKAAITGGLSSLPDEPKTSLTQHSDNASTDAMLRHGHNCGSWAIAMVKALQLPFNETGFVRFVAIYPKSLIKGTHDGDIEEPSSSRNCSMM